MKVLVAVLLVGCVVKSSTSGGTLGTGGGTPSDRVAMPDLMGKTPDEANAALRAAGFSTQVEVNRIALECIGVSQEIGRINCQNPEAGAQAYRSAIINVHVPEEQTAFKGVLVRAQMDKMRGMTIDQAKAYLKSLGHDGTVAVFEQHTWSDSCGVQKVCSAEPSSGTGLHDQVTLVINASTSTPAITMPD